MPSNDTFTPTPELRQTSRMTRRERRRRIILLTLLLLALALLGFLTYWWVSNRAMPIPALQREDVLAPPQYLFSITGGGANRLDRPVGVDVSDDGRVYVVDFAKRRVSVFDRQGRFLLSFNKMAGAESLGAPVHLQVVNDEVWVTDRRQKLVVFGLDGTFKRKFEPKNEAEIRWTPLALAFDKDGRLRVTDVGRTDRHRLMYFSEDGSRTVSVGKTQQITDIHEAPGTFFFPNGLAVADDGRVYVADGDNRRIQVFDDKGTFKEFIDTSGVPRGLAIDDKERLYAVDALAHTVDVYNLDGERLTQFGTRGFGPGQFNFPNDVALDSTGRIYVTDRENDQVQVWGWPALVVTPDIIPSTPWQWALCLIPLLLLPLLLLLRRRKYVLTPAFVDALVEAGQAQALLGKRLKFIAPENEQELYEGRIVDGVELTRVIWFEPFSESDVAATQGKLRCTEREAIYLTMAERSRALLTEDVELRRLGVTAQIRVMDVEEFLADVRGERSQQTDRA